MGLTINQIDDYSLSSIFELLSVREKIAIERVCKRWQQVISDLLISQKGLQLARIPEWMTCKDPHHSTTGGDVCDYLNYPNDEYKVKKILVVLMRKCPQIKYLQIQLSSPELEEGVKIFSWLLWLCPNLQCLRIFVKDQKVIHGFGKAIELIGTKMTHLAVYQSPYWVTNSKNINALINKMPNLQQLLLIGFQYAMSLSLDLGLNLQQLVTDCFSQQNIDSIIRCKKIETLAVFGALDQLGFTKICQNMPQLKHFTARFKESVDDFSPLTLMKKLENFGLSNINYYELKNISSTRMVFRKKNQVFSDLNKTRLAFIRTISVNNSSFNNLRSFSLYGIAIDQKMLISLSKELPNIEELKLNKCCFICECDRRKGNCEDCQKKCSILLSKWSHLRGITFDHPENEVLIQSLSLFKGLRFITINHIRLYPNNRFYLDGTEAWIHCYDIFKSCSALASETDDQIKVDFNIYLDNIIRINVKTPKNLIFNFNYFSNNIC